MSKVVVFMNLTLDGVMQAPGRPDEDRRGGFEHGGWATPYFDSVSGRVAAEGIATQPALLFGRRTYQDFYAVWPKRTGNMFTEVLNNAQKYVARDRRFKRPSVTSPPPSACLPQRSILCGADFTLRSRRRTHADGPHSRGSARSRDGSDERRVSGRVRRGGVRSLPRHGGRHRKGAAPLAECGNVGGSRWSS